MRWYTSDRALTNLRTGWLRIAGDNILAERAAEAQGFVQQRAPVPTCADPGQHWAAAMAHFKMAAQNVLDNPAQASPLTGYAAQQGQLALAELGLLSLRSRGTRQFRKYPVPVEHLVANEVSVALRKAGLDSSCSFTALVGWGGAARDGPG